MAGDGDEPVRDKPLDPQDRVDAKDSSTESPFDSHGLLNQFKDVVGKGKNLIPHQLKPAIL
ncbi:MAG: hypothetical protein K2X77_18825 [Candidatus Obscuribacterales bacterium]|nr:hypothetical protein [Candidatus Obscuribacterales bacterium]